MSTLKNLPESTSVIGLWVCLLSRSTRPPKGGGIRRLTQGQELCLASPLRELACPDGCPMERLRAQAYKIAAFSSGPSRSRIGCRRIGPDVCPPEQPSSLQQCSDLATAIDGNYLLSLTLSMACCCYFLVNGVVSYIHSIFFDLRCPLYALGLFCGSNVHNRLLQILCLADNHTCNLQIPYEYMSYT